MSELRVKVQKNGPYVIEAEALQLLDPEGRAFGLAGRNVVVLCRCGASNNKPFCDGSHNHHGFQDDPQARDLPPKKPAV
jgi:CDGSH-type Zn-finger protein